MKIMVKVLGVVFVCGLCFSNQAVAASFSAEMVMAEVNQARQEAQLESYNESLLLTLAALRKGLDMYVSGHLSHVSLDGRNPWDFVTEAGYKYQSVGENLGFAPKDAASLVEAMLNSPAHRANILSTTHTELGVALVPHPSLAGEAIVVMHFASPRL